MTRPTDPITKLGSARRLKVNEKSVKKKDNIVVNIRMPRELSEAFHQRGNILGIPPSTLMRRVLQAYVEQVIEEEHVFGDDE